MDSFNNTKNDRKLLIEANLLLRSCYAICKRKGRDTNWEAFTLKVKEILQEQYEVLHGDKIETYFKKEEEEKCTCENPSYLDGAFDTHCYTCKKPLR